MATIYLKSQPGIIHSLKLLAIFRLPRCIMVSRSPLSTPAAQVVNVSVNKDQYHCLLSEFVVVVIGRYIEVIVLIGTILKVRSVGWGFRFKLLAHFFHPISSRRVRLLMASTWNWPKDYWAASLSRLKDRQFFGTSQYAIYCFRVFLTPSAPEKL